MFKSHNTECKVNNSHIDESFKHQIVTRDGFYHLQKIKPLKQSTILTNTKIAFERIIKRTYFCEQFQIQNSNIKTMIIKWSLSMSNHKWK